MKKVSVYLTFIILDEGTLENNGAMDMGITVLESNKVRKVNMNNLAKVRDPSKNIVLKSCLTSHDIPPFKQLRERYF